jgi:hypothetical protein
MKQEPTEVLRERHGRNPAIHGGEDVKMARLPNGRSVLPGSPDELTAQQQASDAVRPRESDSVEADLQERMERLPPGHPSSPYNEDGSRKPPAPDPFQNDSPIPGDPDYSPDTPSTGKVEDPQDSSNEDGVSQDLSSSSEADTSSGAEDAPSIGPEGLWEWKGQSLTPEESRSADQALVRCVDVEGRSADGSYGERGLTPAMRRIEVQLDKCHLVERTEDYALKTADRFKEKLSREKVKNPDKTITELASEIHDAIRYTFVLEAESYVATYWEVQGRIEDQGYDLEVRRNMWAGLEYKGINSRWRDPGSGLPFEIQFHTKASWEAKQHTHAAYEKIEDTRTPADERERLREFQKQVSARVQEPLGVIEIPDYRKQVR